MKMKTINHLQTSNESKKGGKIMKKYFYSPLTPLLFVVLISVGCEKEIQPLTLGSEEALHSILKSESAVENLLVNPDFTAPAPTVVVH